MANVLKLKRAVAAKLAALSVDVQGFRDALGSLGTNFFRVVVRDRDAVDYAGGNYLPRRANEAKASIQTSDIEGCAKYLLGRTGGQFLKSHPDFDGLQGPFDGADEIEIQIGDQWFNARTGEMTQADKDALPEPLTP